MSAEMGWGLRSLGELEVANGGLKGFASPGVGVADLSLEWGEASMVKRNLDCILLDLLSVVLRIKQQSCCIGLRDRMPN